MNDIDALRREVANGFTPELVARLFLAAPADTLDDATRAAFDAIYARARASGAATPVAFTGPRAKFEFMRHLSERHGVLWHGTNQTGLAELLPRDQFDYADNPVRAVFASGDAIWSMFFAIVDRATLRGSMRNGCFVVGGHAGGSERRHYFFSVHDAWLARNLWTTGMAYALPRDTFKPTDTSDVRFDEYISEAAVKPLFKLAVTPSDFPFLRQVAGHDERESIYESWHHYKKRISQ